MGYLFGGHATIVQLSSSLAKSQTLLRTLRAQTKHGEVLSVPRSRIWNSPFLSRLVDAYRNLLPGLCVLVSLQATLLYHRCDDLLHLSAVVPTGITVQESVSGEEASGTGTSAFRHNRIFLYFSDRLSIPCCYLRSDIHGILPSYSTSSVHFTLWRNTQSSVATSGISSKGCEDDRFEDFGS